jgi:hypothetical protein
MNVDDEVERSIYAHLKACGDKGSTYREWEEQWKPSEAARRKIMNGGGHPKSWPWTMWYLLRQEERIVPTGEKRGRATVFELVAPREGV